MDTNPPSFLRRALATIESILVSSNRRLPAATLLRRSAVLIFLCKHDIGKILRLFSYIRAPASKRMPIFTFVPLFVWLMINSNRHHRISIWGLLNLDKICRM